MTDTAESSLAATAAAKPPFYRDATVVKWIVQVVTLIAVILAMIFLVGEAGDNLKAKGINTGFDFLNVNPDFSIGDGIDNAPDTGGRALWVGMVNTIRLSVAGIALATILGVLIGISRLSSNWIVAKVASAFIEYMRNIPLLVHIFLLFFTLGQLGDFGRNVDPVTGELSQGPINGWVHVSNKGLSIPRVHIADGFYQWMIFILAGAIVGRWLMNKRNAVRDATGHETYPVLSFVGVIALLRVHRLVPAPHLRLGWRRYLRPSFPGYPQRARGRAATDSVWSGPHGRCPLDQTVPRQSSHPGWPCPADRR